MTKKTSAVKTWSTPVVQEKKYAIPCALCGQRRFKQSLACEGFSYVSCLQCGLMQINPQPAASEVQERYKSFFGNDYLAYQLENENVFLELQKLALKDIGFFKLEKKIMQSGKRPRVLDIGCSTGALLAFLQERQWQPEGIEISPSADYAQKRLGVTINRKNIENSDFPAETFDLVMASHLLEHLNDPNGFLHKVWDILRPGANMILITPNIQSFQAILYKNRWRSAIFDHLYLFSKKNLKIMLKKTGFNVIKISAWGGLPAGSAPAHLKRFADIAVKRLGWGDVMAVLAEKP